MAMMDGMNDMGADPMSPPADAAAPAEQAGYEISICVYGDGSFKVKGPEPLEDKAGEGETEEAGETFDSIGAALKGVLDMIKSNPIGEDAGAQLEAGYGSR